MAIGQQATVQSLNSDLTNLATQVRNLMDEIREWTQGVQDEGSAGLQVIGFTSADATAFLGMAGYLSTQSGVWFGTVQQGGSGGIGATLFNFDNAVSPVIPG